MVELLRWPGIQNTLPLPEGQVYRLGNPTTMIFIHEDDFETVRKFEIILIVTHLGRQSFL